MGDMFTRAKLIVAHPDDECLWFSSVLEKVEEVVQCYENHPKLEGVGEARREARERINRVLAERKLARIISLGMEEVDTFAFIDWDVPVPNRFGLQLNNARAQQRYEANFADVLEQLRPIVADCVNVYTHNPWGEYGHPDHVQLFRVLAQLQSDLGYDLWCTNYASNQTVQHALRYIDGFHPDYVTIDTNVELARELAQAYRLTSSWTWLDSFEWFPTESFSRRVELRDEAGETGSLMPFNFMKLNFQAPEPPPRPTWIDRVRRRIRSF